MLSVEVHIDDEVGGEAVVFVNEIVLAPVFYINVSIVHLDFEVVSAAILQHQLHLPHIHCGQLAALQ